MPIIEVAKFGNINQNITKALMGFLILKINSKTRELELSNSKIANCDSENK